MHLVTIYLDLMSSDDRKEVVLLQNLLYWVQAELETAFSLHILGVLQMSGLFVSTWIGPEEIAKETLEGWLNKPVYFVDVFYCFQFW